MAVEQTGFIPHVRDFDIVPNPEFEGLQRIEPAQYVDRPDGSQRITKVDVHLEDGTVIDSVLASETAYEFKPVNFTGATVVLTVERAHHIQSIHVDGEDSGSTFTEGRLDTIMHGLSLALPREVSTLNYSSQAVQIDFEETVGWDNLRAIDDLVEDGVLSECDRGLLDDYRKHIRLVNLSDDEIAKEKLVRKFNAKHAAVFLRCVRAAQVVVPHVVAEPQPTTIATLAVSTRWRYLGGRGIKYIHSYYPSHKRNDGIGKHPIPGEHKDKTGSINMASFNASAWKWSTHALLVPDRE